MMEFNRKKMSKALAECHGGACFSGCYLFDTAIKDEQMRCMNCLNIANEVIKELTEENERLRAENEALAISEVKECEISQMLVYRIRNKHPAVMAVIADTVSKMHSEIEARCLKGGIYPAFVKSTIDQIVKEIMEGKNATN